MWMMLPKCTSHIFSSLMLPQGSIEKESLAFILGALLIEKLAELGVFRFHKMALHDTYFTEHSWHSKAIYEAVEGESDKTSQKTNLKSL